MCKWGQQYGGFHNKDSRMRENERVCQVQEVLTQTGHMYRRSGEGTERDKLY